MAARQTAVTTLRQQTPAWVDGRRDYIGSADIPIITGSTPYATSLFSLWAYKTRKADPEPPDPELAETWLLGHLLEDDIATIYMEREQRGLRRAMRMLVRRDVPWASASLDRVSAVKGERRIVEIKWIPRRFWLHDGPDPVPPYVMDQIQWQLYVSEFDVVDVAVLDGSRVTIHRDIGPSTKYQDDLVYLARHFREENIEAGLPPKVDSTEATRQALTRLHPRETLDWLPASLETDALAGDLRDAIAAAKLANAREDELRNVARSVIGDHSGIEGDGYRMTWTKYADSKHVDWQSVARGYRMLLELVGEALMREQLAKLTLEESDEQDLAKAIVLRQGASVPLPELLDALVGLATTSREGARVLRPRFRNEEDGRWQ